jgi:hypothetical protein
MEYYNAVHLNDIGNPWHMMNDFCNGSFLFAQSAYLIQKIFLQILDWNPKKFS